MRIIVIEDNVYKVTEKQFREIMNKQVYLNDGDLAEWFKEKKSTYKYVGVIEYQWRL